MVARKLQSRSVSMARRLSVVGFWLLLATVNIFLVQLNEAFSPPATTPTVFGVSSSFSQVSKPILNRRRILGVEGKMRLGTLMSAQSSSSPKDAFHNNDYIDVQSQDDSSSVQPTSSDIHMNMSRTGIPSSWLQKTVQSSRRIQARIQGWMKKIVLWQQTKGRSLVAAAVLSFSILVLSNKAITNHVPQQQQQSATEIHRVASSAPGTPAGAATSNHRVSSSFQQHDMLAASTRGGGGGSNKNKATMTKSPAASSSLSFDKKSSSLLAMRSMEEGMATASVATQRTLRDAMVDLSNYMRGPKSDTLLLLLATALITPICKTIKISPILGFLASGMLLGPNGCGLISGIHTTETLAELGIVFFLFEMGIELSFDRLLSMRKDVFGLGLCQFLVTGLAVAGAGAVFGGLPANALIVLGGGIALSSSAFVLQLLKDKNQLATRFGKASFGILLFQDLAVVPLLVVTPILAGAGSGLASAVGAAVLKAGIALGSIAVVGRFVLNPLFKTVAQAQSQEAFLGVILLTVLSMSFMTEGLGLSNTLGAFLAGVLLSETKYRYQVEADIAPFRGILLGFFFVTVGFEIDLRLIAAQTPLVASIVFGILAVKASVAAALSLAFGLSLPTSLQTGLILSQGGEFAFVAFGLARSLGILSVPTTKLLLTSVSLTMALTPFMATLGERIAKQLEEKTDFTHYLGQDRDASEIKESDDFAVIVGYGAVGKIVCSVLDSKLIKYVGLEIDPNKAIQARNKGLPVFYGDIGRQEVAEAFNVGKAKAVIVCISDKQQANRAVIALRRWYPNLKIFARATDADHASRLQNTLNVAAMVPILPEDNLLLTLPFAGAVMKALGVPTEEVNAILTSKRRAVLAGRGIDDTEEEFALVQLGIPEGSLGKGSGESDKMDKAAAARRQEALQKSPFVAEVIEDVCPGSVCVEDDDDDFVEGDVVLQEALKTGNKGEKKASIQRSAVLDADVSPVPAAAAATEESSSSSSATGTANTGGKDIPSPLTDDTNAFQ